MQRMIKIQSFGDIITNSSSEVYTMYDRSGVEQIEEAIKNIAHVLNPSINLDDHITIELVPSSDADWYDDDIKKHITFEEYYNKKFNEYCLEHNNDDILLNFSQWLSNFQDETYVDDNGMPLWDIKITGLTDLGEQLARGINNILYAFDHEEIYT